MAKQTDYRLAERDQWVSVAYDSRDDSVKLYIDRAMAMDAPSVSYANQSLYIDRTEAQKLVGLLKKLLEQVEDSDVQP